MTLPGSGTRELRHFRLISGVNDSLGYTSLQPLDKRGFTPGASAVPTLFHSISRREGGPFSSWMRLDFEWEGQRGQEAGLALGAEEIPNLH